MFTYSLVKYINAPYSRKFWWALNLVDWPKTGLMNFAVLSLGLSKSSGLAGLRSLAASYSFFANEEGLNECKLGIGVGLSFL